MGTHSSILAWKIPWMEEPGGLQSMVTKEQATAKPPNNNKMAGDRKQARERNKRSPYSMGRFTLNGYLRKKATV